MATCRLVLICESTSKIIPPLLSRCLLILCPSPSDSQIVSILQNTGEQAFGSGASASATSTPAVPAELAKRIAKEAKGNLRRALLMLDACRAMSGVGATTAAQSVGGIILDPHTPLVIPDWEEVVHEIAKIIIKNQTAAAFDFSFNSIYISSRLCFLEFLI